MARLMRLYESGRRDGTFEAGIEFALRGILASAKFVFRGERDPRDRAAGARLSASAISSSRRGCRSSSGARIPDDELLSVASQGRLKDPAVLDRQVRRMLADPKAGRSWTTSPGSGSTCAT